jgi:hypothetical protein
MMHLQAKKRLRRWSESTSILEEREYCGRCGDIVFSNERCSCTDQVGRCGRQSLGIEACEHENE